jgi:hypothetical protein
MAGRERIKTARQIADILDRFLSGSSRTKDSKLGAHE